MPPHPSELSVLISCCFPQRLFQIWKFSYKGKATSPILSKHLSVCLFVFYFLNEHILLTLLLPSHSLFRLSKSGKPVCFCLFVTLSLLCVVRQSISSACPAFCIIFEQSSIAKPRQLSWKNILFLKKSLKIFYIRIFKNIFNTLF